jgi:hypothetical protein
LDFLEENIYRREEGVEFDGNAKRSSFQVQLVPFRSSPGPPLDYDDETARQGFLAKSPLQGLDLSAASLIVEIQA